jgi:hypothetical protein
VAARRLSCPAEEAAAVRAAVAWWRSRRPLDFSEDEHLANPTVNTTDGAEADLARAAARVVRARKRERAATGRGAA